MLDLQYRPLQHETQYALDVLIDENSIDSASAVVLKLYGDRALVDGIVERREESWRRKLGIAAELMDYSTDLIGQMPLDRQGALASVTLTHLDYMSRDTAKFMAMWAIGDLVEGGNGEHANRPVRCRRGTAMPFKKDWRRLHSPNWIRRYVKHEAESWRVRRVADHVLPRFRGLDPALIHGGLELFQEDKAESDRRRRAYEAEQWAKINAQIAAGIPADEAIRQPDNVIVRLKPGIRKKLRRERLEYRKVARRGIATAQAIVGPEKTAAFVRGEPVLLEGVNLNFAIQRTGSVAGKGHGQISLEAVRTDGMPLADLCFYVEDTPAIDQLTAVALHCAAGEEHEIVVAANLIRAQTGCLDHPAFQQKMAERVALLAERAGQRALVLDDDGVTPLYVEGPNWHKIAGIHLPVEFRELADKRDEDYWQETSHVWTEAFQVFMVGAKWRKVMLRNSEEAECQL